MQAHFVIAGFNFGEPISVTLPVCLLSPAGMFLDAHTTHLQNMLSYAHILGDELWESDF